MSDIFVNAKTVTDKQLTFYRKNGYCVVQNIFSLAECQKAIDEAERLAKNQEVTYAPIMHPHQMSKLFYRLLSHAPLIHAMEILLGEKIWGLQSMLYYKKPGALGRDVHQDNFYARAKHHVYAGAWLAMDDADEENGCLFVYPGSQAEPLLDVVKNDERHNTVKDSFVNDRGRSCIVPGGYQKVYLPMKAGSVVFTDGNLLHGSAENRSKNRFRRAFISHYICQGNDFRRGEHARREIINVYPRSEDRPAD